MKLKVLQASALKLNIGGLDHNWYIARVPMGTEYQDLFSPVFWTHHKGKLVLGDIIRVVEEEGGFDVCITVVALTENGHMIFGPYPKVPGQSAVLEKKAVDVPLSQSDGEPMVRVEHSEVTKWRVRGYDGHEISRDHKTRAAAEAVMNKYLEQMNFKMPDAAAVQAAKAAIAAKKAKTEKAPA